jgi:2-phosphoglycerate kinase
MKEKELFTTVKPEIVIGQLFQSRDIIHIAHLQTTSFSEHKALDGYYTDIIGLTDDIVESYFGTIGKRLNFKIPASEYMNAKTHLIYMKDYMMKHRGVFGMENTHLQNSIDEVLSLITSTLYKLTLT